MSQVAHGRAEARVGKLPRPCEARASVRTQSRKPPEQNLAVAHEILQPLVRRLHRRVLALVIMMTERQRPALGSATE